MSIESFAEALLSVRSVTILSHMRPDGDTLGSALSLSLALDSLGIENEMVCESVIPETFLHFPLAKLMKREPKLDAEAIVCVDCSDEKRLGLLGDWFLRARKKKFNIDHHISNTNFADYNYVNLCSANCLNMARLYKAMGVELTKEMANYLLMGLLTDSGAFSHSDVDGDALRVAGDLLDRGGDLGGLSYHLFKRQRMERFRLNTRVMSKVRFALEDRLAFVVVLQEDLKETGAKQEMTEGFVDFPLTVDSVEVSCALLEVKKEQFKISLRSKGKVNVNAVASRFGGGGHILASGCMLFGTLEEVIDRLSFAVSRELP